MGNATVEAVAAGFALAVMAWVIYRLTWTIVRLVNPTKEVTNAPSASEPESDGEVRPEG